MDQDEYKFWNETVRRENCDGFCSNIYQYREKNKYTDVKIVCQDSRVFECHRLILMAVGKNFERMFETGAKEIRLDIDGAEFDYVVQFAYEGTVPIDDENVLTLFRLSHRFEMKALEDWCVRYLTERNIPTNHAVELFGFAYTAQKTTLIISLARFILNNLREVAKVGAGLEQMNLEQMRELLAYWQSSTRKRERELLIVLAHWISRLDISQHPFKQALSIEFAENLPFDHFDEATVKLRLQTRVDIIPDASSSKPLSRLYMYIKNSHRDEDFSIFSCSRTSEESFTLKPHGQTEKVGEDLKVVALKDRLYSWSFHQEAQFSRLSFSRYSSVNLSANTQKSLNLPEGILPRAPGQRFNSVDFGSLHACSDPISRIIYLSHNFHSTSVWYRKVSMYVCDVDMWFPVVHNYRNDLSDVVMMSCSDSQLYMLGLSKTLHAYDYRTGEIRRLADSLSFAFHGESCCCHKGKLYKTLVHHDDEGRVRVRLQVYDPVAERWSEFTSSSAYQPIDHDVRLISYDDRLWMFGRCIDESKTENPKGHHYHFQRYDSFLENWDGESSLRIGLSNSVADIIVFDS